MQQKLIIGISESRFTVSEALALFIFRSYNEDNIYEVRRVTNIEDCTDGSYDVLIGAGDKFDAKNLMFSHYGRTRYNMQSMKILYGYTEPLSTAGLVYANYGKLFLKKLYPNNNVHLSDLRYNFRRIYEFSIEIIDRYIFKIPITYSTNEKEKFMKYLNEFSAELEKALRNAHKKSDLDFLTVVDVYSSKIGEKFYEILNWYFNEYLVLMYELTKSMMYSVNIHSSSRIAVCDFDFGKVTFQEVLMRVKKYIVNKFHVRMAQLLVVKSKDCYRVECLCTNEEGDNPKVVFPVDWPLKGDEIERILEISDVSYISDCGKYAIASTKQAAIALAVALVEYYSENNILPAKNPNLSRSSDSLHSFNDLSYSNCSSHLSKSTYSIASELYNRGINNNSSPLTKGFSQCSSYKSVEELSLSESDENENAEKKRVFKQEKLTKKEGVMEKESGELFDDSSSSAATDDDGEFEFVFNVICDEEGCEETSLPKQVSVALSWSNTSMSALNAALHAKYPGFGAEFGLCYRGGKASIAKNRVTESPRFWRLHYTEICFARLPSHIRTSATTSNTSEDDLYETTSGTKSIYDNAGSTQILPQRDNMDEFLLGSNSLLCVNYVDVLKSPSGAELLACAIILSDLKLSLIDVNFIDDDTRVNVKIGCPDVLSYSDGINCFTEKNIVSMMSMDIMLCEKRMSCAGIAYVNHGLKSIANILVPVFNANVCEGKNLFRVFRRVYARLIQPIDQIAIANLESNKKNGHVSAGVTAKTREAELFVSTFGWIPSEPDNPPFMEEGVRMQFNFNLHLALKFYRQLVTEVFRQLFLNETPC